MQDYILNPFTCCGPILLAFPLPFHSLCPLQAPLLAAVLHFWLCEELACCSYSPMALSMPYHAAPSNSTSWTWPCTSSNKSSSTDHSPTASGSLTLSLLIVPILNGDTCHSLGVHLLGCWRKAAEPLSCVCSLCFALRSYFTHEIISFYFAPLFFFPSTPAPLPPLE